MTMDTLLLEGYKKQKLRAPFPITCGIMQNDWALTFWNFADIMVESKAKKSASGKIT